LPIAGGGEVIEAAGLATAGLSTGASTGLAFTVDADDGAGGSAFGAGAVTGEGKRRTCRSLAPSRRSCQGSFNAGRPKVCPPSDMLNNIAWMTAEITTAVLNRQRSRWPLSYRPKVIAEVINTDYHKGDGY
jgi:hypothetical protein